MMATFISGWCCIIFIWCISVRIFSRTPHQRRGLEIEVDEVNGYKEVEVNILRGRHFVIILRSISL